MSYFQARLAEVQIPPKKPQKYLFHVPRTDEPLLHGKRGFFNSLRTEAVKNHTKSNSNHCRKILERTEPLMNNRQTQHKATGNHGGSSAEGNLSKETETGLFLQP